MTAHLEQLRVSALQRMAATIRETAGVMEDLAEVDLPNGQDPNKKREVILILAEIKLATYLLEKRVGESMSRETPRGPDFFVTQSLEAREKKVGR